MLPCDRAFSNSRNQKLREVNLSRIIQVKRSEQLINCLNFEALEKLGIFRFYQILNLIER